MPRLCSVCSHKQHAAIDSALLAHAAGYGRIAAGFGLAETSIRRHMREHLAERIRGTEGAREMLDAQALSAKLEELDGYATRVLQRSEEAHDDRLVLMGIETAGRNLERIFKIGVTTDLEQRLKRLEEGGTQ